MSVNGFTGPINLAQCEFRAGVTPAAPQFTILVTEASDPDPEDPRPIIPLPAVVVSQVACEGTPAVCGDAIVDEFEECDDGGTVDGDGCSRFCEVQRKCGDATGDGKVMASDALRILQRAVGLDVDCPTWICDVDGNGVQTADGLKILRRSIELPTVIQCGTPTSVVLRILSSTTLGSLQISIDYTDAPGNFHGEVDQVECQVLQSGVNASFNNKPTRRLAASFASLFGIYGPGSLASCTFEPLANVDTEDFEVTVNEAANSGGHPVSKPLIIAVPY